MTQKLFPTTRCIVACFMTLVLSVSARADIYRFVTLDGVETFTDAPQESGAKLIVKNARPKGRKPAASSVTSGVHEISLDEIAEKTVRASIIPQQSPVSSEPRLPPVGGVITSTVGMRVDPVDGKWRHHNGIDIAIPEGTPVNPAAPGIVIYSGLRPGYGHTVLVEHPSGMISLYGHNSVLRVSAGQQVGSDTVIALSGNTGRSTGPHLHFEAWQNGTNVTAAFMPGASMKIPLTTRVASNSSKARFRREILSDGSILFTNLP